MLTRILATTAMTLALAAFAGQGAGAQEAPAQPQAEQEQMRQQDPQRQDQQAEQQQEQAEPGELPMSQLSMAQSDTIKGSAVRGIQGEQIGDIEDIVVSMPDGQVSYVIVGVGGFLGVGEKSVAVPWERLQPGQEPETFVLDVDRQTLANAPAVDVEQFAASPDPQTIEQISQFWEQEQQQQRQEQPQP